MCGHLKINEVRLLARKEVQLKFWLHCSQKFINAPRWLLQVLSACPAIPIAVCHCPPPGKKFWLLDSDPDMDTVQLPCGICVFGSIIIFWSYFFVFQINGMRKFSGNFHKFARGLLCAKVLCFCQTYNLIAPSRLFLPVLYMHTYIYGGTGMCRWECGIIFGTLT